jgi:hypothetical protein
METCSLYRIAILLNLLMQSSWADAGLIARQFEALNGSVDVSPPAEPMHVPKMRISFDDASGYMALLLSGRVTSRFF